MYTFIRQVDIFLCANALLEMIVNSSSSSCAGNELFCFLTRMVDIVALLFIFTLTDLKLGSSTHLLRFSVRKFLLYTSCK